MQKDRRSGERRERPESQRCLGTVAFLRKVAVSHGGGAEPAAGVGSGSVCFVQSRLLLFVLFRFPASLKIRGEKRLHFPGLAENQSLPTQPFLTVPATLLLPPSP